MKGWLKAIALVVVAVGIIGVIGVLRAEREILPVPTQRDLDHLQGVPVEVAEVEHTEVSRQIRLYGTLQGRAQAEVVAATPNLLQKVHVEVGQTVRRGQLLASMRDTALSPLGFRHGPLKAQFEAAQADLERVEALHAEGGITDQQRDHAQAQFDAARSDYEAAVAAIRITAPISGTVTRIDYRVGEMVPNDRPLMQIADIDAVTADVMAESVDVALIEVGQTVEIHTSALPGRTFSGTVVERSLGAYPVINQFRVRAEIANPGHELLPGYPVEVNILAGAGEPVLAVPRGAVVEGEEGAIVWCVEQDGTARRVPVQTGVFDAQLIEVLGELADGDRVVTTGQVRIEDDGAKLIVVDAR